MTYAIGLNGGNPLPNPSGGIPYGWIIDVEGKVVWQGNGAAPEKIIEAELKKVQMTPERKAARAERMLAYGQSLIGEKQFVRGMALLQRVPKEYKGTEAAKKAEEALAAVEKDETAKAEIAAQKELDRIVTGLEQPKEKLKGKERDGIAARLEGFLKKHKEAAPVAAEMASMQIKVMTEKWELTAR
jgi:hypothetical protein